MIKIWISVVDWHEIEGRKRNAYQTSGPLLSCFLFVLMGHQPLSAAYASCYVGVVALNSVESPFPARHTHFDILIFGKTDGLNCPAALFSVSDAHASGSFIAGLKVCIRGTNRMQAVSVVALYGAGKLLHDKTSLFATAYTSAPVERRSMWERTPLFRGLPRTCSPCRRPAPPTAVFVVISTAWSPSLLSLASTLPSCRREVCALIACR